MKISDFLIALGIAGTAIVLAAVFPVFLLLVCLIALICVLYKVVVDE